MVEILAPGELASYLGQDWGDDLTLITELVNGVITDAWLEPADPAPAHVRALAFTVAARAASNRKGLTSWTLSWDDTTRTERTGEAARAGIYLTDAEKADLNPEVATRTRRAGSIRLGIPGWR